MFERIIAFSLKNKALILIAVVGLIGYGIYAASKIPLDAVPDITNNQVQVVTTSPSLAPQEVEQFITYPIEISLANIPEAKEIRSISRYGLSVITVVFEENMDVLSCRQYVKEQLDIAKSNIPSSLGNPELMPITTGLGEIYQYVLEVKPGHERGYSIMELRTIQDWIIKRQLTGLKGIVEVSSFGGLVKQYEVSLDPQLLEANDVSIKAIFEALSANNQNTGGSYIEQGPNAFYLRTEGLLKSMEDIENVVVVLREGNPILIKDIAKVKLGAPPRYGAMTMDGKGEVVGGITLMLKGANSSEAIKNVKSRINEIQKSLPEGIIISPYLDRSKLVNKTISTVTNNLVEGGLIVIFILILLLGNWRSGVVVASVIPLAMLFALIMMHWFGVSANLMSLGAIDFGIVVDGAVIIVESIIHSLFLYHNCKVLSQKALDDVIYGASAKLSKSAAFGVFIILVVFIPILTLEGIEGKMFTPMAQTVSFAILGALILSVTYIPVISSLVLKKAIKEKETFSDKIIEKLKKLYLPSLKYTLNRPYQVVAASIVALAFALFGFVNLGGEFIPTLEEGDLAMQMTIKPGSSLQESIKTSTKAEKILKSNFPEVIHVISKIGTAEVPTDPMAIEDADVMIILKPKELWESASTREELVEKMKKELEVVLGASFEFTQPIQLRFNELLTGSKSDISIKIFGEDLATLSELGRKAQNLIEPIKGAGDVKLEQTEGFPQLSVSTKREKLSEYGISVEDVNQTLRAAYAGEEAGVIYEGEKRFALTIRLDESKRTELDLSSLFVESASGQKVHLNELCDVSFKEGPMQVSRENTQRRISVGINVRNRDVASLVEEIKQILETNLKLPAGYYISYGGQFENLQRAQKRLGFVVPVSLLLILFLLFAAFGKIKYALLIFSGVPFAAIGGVAALYIRGMPFSISAGIGFIALFGVAVLNGIVLLSYMIELEKENSYNLKDLILKAGATRLRPVIMTAAVASFGFLPMAISASEGAEVQKPLASVVIGGLITSTLLTLIVLPVLYYIIHNKKKMSYPPQLSSVLLIVGLFMLPGISFSQEYPKEMTTFLEKVKSSNLELQSSELMVKQAGIESRASTVLPKTEFTYQYGQINSGLQDYNWQIVQNFGVLPQHFSQNKRLNNLELFYKSTKEARTIEIERIAAQLYLEAWKQNAKQKVWEEILEEVNSFVSLNELRYEAGEIGLVEKTQSLTFLKEVSQEKLLVDIKLSEAVASLKNICNCNESPSFPEEVKNFYHTNDTLQVNSTLLLPLNNKLQAVNYEINNSKGGFFPEVSVGYFNQQLDGVRGFQGVIVGLNAPLWFKPQSAEVQKSKVASEMVKTELEQKTFSLTAKLESIEQQINIYEDILLNFQSYLDFANQLERASATELKSGEIDVWQYLHNYREISQIRIQNIEHKITYNQLIVEQEFLKE